MKNINWYKWNFIEYETLNDETFEVFLSELLLKWDVTRLDENEKKYLDRLEKLKNRNKIQEKIYVIFKLVNNYFVSYKKAIEWLKLYYKESKYESNSLNFITDYVLEVINIILDNDEVLLKEYFSEIILSEYEEKYNSFRRDRLLKNLIEKWINNLSILEKRFLELIYLFNEWKIVDIDTFFSELDLKYYEFLSREEVIMIAKDLLKPKYIIKK